MKPPGFFERKFGSHQLRELGRGVKVRQYPLIPQSDTSRHGTLRELSESVELQQDRRDKEFVQKCRIQQPGHKCSAILETPQGRFLETGYLRFKVERSAHGRDRSRE